jgi:hypothetical protein
MAILPPLLDLVKMFRDKDIPSLKGGECWKDPAVDGRILDNSYMRMRPGLRLFAISSNYYILRKP